MDVNTSDGGELALGTSQKEIAEILGISKVTVSRALNNNPLVSPDMKRRVVELCQQLDYYPHFGSRALHSRSVNAISVIRNAVHLTDLHSKWIYHLQQEAHSQGYMLRLDAVDSFSRIAAEHSADGFIVFDSEDEYMAGHPRLSAALASGTIPMVLIDCQSRTMVPDTVAVDNFGAMRSIVDHLVGLGHRQIAFTGTRVHSVGRERHDGFLTRLLELGLPTPEDFQLLSPDWAMDVSDTHGLRDGLYRAVDMGATAMATSSDLFAVGTVKMLLERGLRVPQDMSVTGFDDSLLSRAFEPAITTITQRVDEVARRAVAMLIKRLTTGESMPGELVSTSLLVRGTTGRVRPPTS